MADTLKRMISFDFDDLFVPEVFSSMIVILILIILSLCIYISSRKALKNPLKAPKGIFNIACIGVEKAENLVVSVMGEKNRRFSAYVVPLFSYVFLAFIFGLTGLESPMTYFGVPLSLALVSFIMIHAQAIKTNKWGYFKRYTDPLPIFLPINLITMWAPLLSMSLRMFGNAIAGYCLMGMIYYGTESLSYAIFNNASMMEITSTNLNSPTILLFAPIATPIFHAYFDLFSGVIQTLVFTMLTMINVYQEQNDDDVEETLERIQYQ